MIYQISRHRLDSLVSLLPMARKTYQRKKEPVSADEKLILDLVRYGLDGESNSIRHLSRRLLRQAEDTRSASFRKDLGALLVGDASSPLRSAADVAMPVEPETRLPLGAVQRGPTEDPPILPGGAAESIDRLIEARIRASALIEAGVRPPRTVLLTGPPGVGKSMTAGWLATRLDIPLVTVELATVMSSFLGKTGQNVQRLLDHSREVACVLFLDEFDAIAKSRDDQTEIGELKRLVNMLLLELDRWPASGLLVAATNHPQLLDPAVERRFDLTVEIALPALEQRREILRRALGRISLKDRPAESMITAAALAFDGESGAGLERLVDQAGRAAVVDDTPLSTVFGELIAERLLSEVTSREQRVAFAGIASEELGMTQREIASILGVSHPTVGKLAADWRKTAGKNGGRPRRAPSKKASTSKQVGTKKGRGD